ncbi:MULTISPECIES: lipocalin family protein [Flavobacterium]|uniref:Lipocalin family protein n=2 Tax=Flavobacterium TaxID=237 RepID=A0A940X9X1_9FLAO|nr:MULTISPECIES: lipocalin family protein [Flavobacterium]MBP4138006.1 lipocalin family protein [Flavobacterium geliluteum]MDX6180849.1 lipocalin family protein [Flavobacterium sp. Fl-33]MDX6184449.1 lipocalin family protein [Flavobacterium sp. Fl-77]UFH39558.1 lipocalin family protein [Flavobacterium sp. F-70]
MNTKRIVLALALSIGLFATSCSNDDNEGETLAPIEGKWEIVQVGTTINGVETLIDAPQNTSGCDRDYLNLKIDNTAITGDYDSTVSACALTTASGIYSRSHNNLTVVIDGVTKTSDIVNLTLKELKLKDANGIIAVYHK